MEIIVPAGSNNWVATGGCPPIFWGDVATRRDHGTIQARSDPGKTNLHEFEHRWRRRSKPTLVLQKTYLKRSKFIG